MESYNNIGIDSSLDWKQIRKLLKIGVFAAFVVLAGDMLLGWGITNESKNGIEQFFSRYLSVSDGRIFWSALLGLIGIPIEGLCYFVLQIRGLTIFPKGFAFTNVLVIYGALYVIKSLLLDSAFKIGFTNGLVSESMAIFFAITFAVALHYNRKSR